MCKILLIPTLTDETSKNAYAFLKACQPYMSKKDSHGFGYMAIDSKGKLLAEKWKNPKNAFKVYTGKSTLEQKIEESLGNVISFPMEYSSFGNTEPRPLRSMCIHSRMATGEINIENTHPFVAPGGLSALIHNGVVDTSNLTQKTSTCDSEGILNLYNKHKVRDDLDKMKEVSTTLKGWWACGIYAKTKKGWILDIIRDDQAKLQAVYVAKLKSMVFCTDIDIVLKTLAKLKWAASTQVAEIDDYIHIRYQVITGKVMDVQYLDPPITTSVTGIDSYWDSRHGYGSTEDYDWQTGRGYNYNKKKGGK